MEGVGGCWGGKVGLEVVDDIAQLSQASPAEERKRWLHTAFLLFHLMS